jgi:subfamily B ATP-binding cassette protein MsbA
MLVLLRPHGLRLLAGVVCLAALAATGAAYAYLAGPVVELMVSGGARGRSYLPSLPGVERALGLSATASGLATVAALLLALALVKGLANLGQALFLEGTAERMGFDLRTRLYAHLMRLPLGALRRLALGDLLVRLLDDVRRVQEAAVMAPLAFVRESLSALALLGVALFMAPGLTLVASVALPLVGLVIGLLGRQVKRAAQRSQERMGALASRAAEGLAAVREVKSCGAEERETDLLRGHGREALSWSLRHIAARAVGPLFNETLAACALGLVLLGVGRAALSPALSPERFISFFAAVLLMYRPVKEIGRAAHQVAGGRASVARVRELLNLAAEPRSSGRRLRPLQRRLDLRGIVFSYDPREDRKTLHGVDLSLEVGRVVVLTGPSGSGKTTLGNVVCGLDQPQAGQIVWDGDDVSDQPLEDLRAEVALVPQQPLLLDGTVADNLRYGAPHATQADLRRAISAAGLDSFMIRLPDGYWTRIGPGGLQPSTGEVQRLAIARALLRQVNVVVLDEPSSALDRDNEQRLMETLREIARTRAVLVIAHSPGLVGVADEVVRLHEGQLVQAQDRPAPATSGAAARTGRGHRSFLA